jgi:hypothetical protein
MPDSTYLGLGLVALLAAGAAHYMGWRRFLAGQLGSQDPGKRRSALVRWGRFAVGWQLLVLVAGGAWVALIHGRGYLWAAPAVGLLIGTALPLQFVVLDIARGSRR